MKHLIALLLYHVGDLLYKLDEKLDIEWLSTYSLYSWCMTTSAELDDGRIWKENEHGDL